MKLFKIDNDNLVEHVMSGLGARLMREVKALDQRPYDGKPISVHDITDEDYMMLTLKHPRLHRYFTISESPCE